MIRKLSLCLSMLLVMVCIGELNAKPEKIKFSKYLVYEGDVDLEEPSGHGVLTCIDPQSKETPFLSVEGDFNGSYISNATLIAANLGDMRCEGSFSYKVDNIDKDACSLQLVMGMNGSNKLMHNNINIASEIQSYIKVKGERMTLSFNKKDKVWTAGFGDENETNHKFIAIIENVDFPTVINNFGYSTKNLKGTKCTMEICADSIVSVDKACTFIFDDAATFCDNKLSFRNGGTYLVNGDSWTGKHKFVDGTEVEKLDEGNNFRVTYNNGDRYEGSLSGEPLSKTLGYGATKSSIRYLNGFFVSGGERMAWIDGESFEERHQRLMAIYQVDLVDSLENNVYTKEQCDSAMLSRIELKRQADEEMKKKVEAAEMLDYAEIMKNHWNATESISLKGTVSNWTIENLENTEGLTPKMFNSNILLNLRVNREAMFFVNITPSDEALKSDVATVSKVMDVCKLLSRQVSGNWGVNGMDILINSQLIGLSFSEDGKSVIYKTNGIEGIISSGTPAAAKKTTKGKTSTSKKKK